MNPLCMIKVKGVSKTYPNGVTALEEVNLKVDRGNSCAIIGPSGCGKSTLLLIMAGLLKPTTGEVMIDDSPVNGPVRNASLILQDYGLFPWKTVYENAALGLRFRGVSNDVEREIVGKLLEKFGLSEFEKEYPKRLSGGMKQRLAIARALAIEPEILFMDEPFSSLDALSREQMQNFLVNLWKETKMTIVFVTHSIEEAVFLGKKIVIFTPRPGRVKIEIKNRKAGSIDYRNSKEYFEKCREVRQSIEFAEAF